MTEATVPEGSTGPVMKTTVSRTTARAMFAAGPAAIATSRFHVGAFQ